MPPCLRHYTLLQEITPCCPQQIQHLLSRAGHFCPGQPRAVAGIGGPLSERRLRGPNLPRPGRPGPLLHEPASAVQAHLLPPRRTRRLERPAPPLHPSLPQRPPPTPPSSLLSRRSTSRPDRTAPLAPTARAYRHTISTRQRPPAARGPARFGTSSTSCRGSLQPPGSPSKPPATRARRRRRSGGGGGARGRRRRRGRVAEVVPAGARGGGPAGAHDHGVGGPGGWGSEGEAGPG